MGLVTVEEMEHKRRLNIQAEIMGISEFYTKSKHETVKIL